MFHFLATLYVIAAVFGVGVTIISMLGFLHHSDDGHDGHDSHDMHDSGHTDTHHDTHISEANENIYIAESHQKEKFGYLISAFSLLRYLVFFCLGFGPVGLFILFYIKNVSQSILYSTVSGIIVVFSFWILKRTLYKDIDSQFRESDFLMEKGKVIVSIGEKGLGKVRIMISGTYQERYARSKDGRTITVGTDIVVVDITDECLIVEIN